MVTQVDKQAIRAEMDTTRQAYEDLVGSIGHGDWSKPSANADLTVKEVIWHIAFAMGWMASSVEAVKSGKSMRIPRVVVDPARKLAMRWLARGATPESSLRKYAAGHAAMLAALDRVHDDDWERTVMRMGETRSVGWYFRNIKEHFEEHSEDVRRVLASSG